MLVVTLLDISEKKKEYLRAKMMNMKITVRSKISETCIGASTALRRVTSLE